MIFHALRPKAVLIQLATLVMATQITAQTDYTKSAKNLEALAGKIEEVRYKGKNAVRLSLDTSGAGFALIKGAEIQNGTLEAEVAAKVLSDSIPGFIGIAFRVQQVDTLRYECFYIRPKNGRSEDQLRRNHALQYVSAPNFPWHRLRRENAGVYESYVDLEVGEWTKIKIVVNDRDARLYVNDSAQPNLIVKDLKLGNSKGGVALWIGQDTEGYFSDVKMTHQK